MTQLGWVIDLDKCTGCHACSVACMAENNTSPLASPLTVRNGRVQGAVIYRKVLHTMSGSYPTPNLAFVTMSCNHCEFPACMKSCPKGAISKRASDGVVLIDQAKCIGCKYCVWACPYGAPQYNEATKKVEKCTLCAHRLAEGLQPACVTTCSGRALSLEEFDMSRSGENAPAGFTGPKLTHPSVRFVKG